MLGAECAAWAGRKNTAELFWRAPPGPICFRSGSPWEWHCAVRDRSTRGSEAAKGADASPELQTSYAACTGWAMKAEALMSQKACSPL